MKIGYFITARLKSTRLKEKILLPLKERTVLDHVIERCKNVVGNENVVLCTSTNPQDSVLFKSAQNHQIKFYPGSENDVLVRLENAANYYGFDAFVSITADNPLHSIKIALELIKQYKENNFDFTFTKGLPIGVAPYFIRTDALRVANYMKKDSDTEIWGPFVNRSDFFNIGILQVTNSVFKEEKRLTCDMPQDYELFKFFFDNYYFDFLDVKEINEIFIKNPKLWEINKSIIQRAISEETLNDINTNFNKMVDDGKKYAIDNGIILKPGLTTKLISI